MSNVINKVHVLLMSIARVTNLNVNITSTSYKKYSNHINHEMVIELSSTLGISYSLPSYYLIILLYFILNKKYMILVE